VPNPVLTFYYDKKVKLTTKSKSFKEAIKYVLERKEPTKFTPIKMVAESTGKTLYFDENKFKAFLQGEYTETEIIQATECEGIFRNTDDVTISKDDVIDSGALWKLIDKHYVLVDDDRFLAIKCPPEGFEEI
jgi:hypothetical protein